MVATAAGAATTASITNDQIQVVDAAHAILPGATETTAYLVLAAPQDAPNVVCTDTKSVAKLQKMNPTPSRYSVEGVQLDLIYMVSESKASQVELQCSGAEAIAYAKADLSSSIYIALITHIFIAGLGVIALGLLIWGIIALVQTSQKLP
ncbi:hypothetical protein [Devriesea agamarum]|uniref:hypothetical protein n=1 Tax=Devriesea agamarum TaxID=472569 RepID=UPI00071E3D66|nr:hypothetical protein [Devriesea agamarum]